MGPKPKPIVDRFESKVKKTPTCWLWSAQIDKGTGYGKFGMTVGDRWRMRWAHRVAFELFKGPLSDGATVDHLCRVRACVNPEHLEAVTHAENIRRGESPAAQAARRETCANGHVYTDENTKIAADGARQCRTCQREWQRSNRSRINAAQRERRRRMKVESIERQQDQAAPASQPVSAVTV